MLLKDDRTTLDLYNKLRFFYMLENQSMNVRFLLFFRGKVEIKIIFIKIGKSGLKGSVMLSGRQKSKRNFVLPYTTRANIYISPVLPINSQQIAPSSVGEQSRPSGNGAQGGVFSVSDVLSPGLIQQQQAQLTCLIFQRVRDDDYLVLQ